MKTFFTLVLILFVGLIISVVGCEEQREDLNYL